MTSTTDTAEHPDVTEISDLAEGLLPASRTSDIRQHLEGCDLCADVYASLEEIRGLLGTLPGPPRMPEDVAGRIDAALAAEALLSAEVVSRETREPVSRETPLIDASPLTAPTVDRPSGRSHAAVGPGRKTRPSRRRRGAALGAVLTAAALGVGALLLQNGDGTPTAGKTRSADTFAEESLDTKVSELIGPGGESAAPLATEKPSFGTRDSGPKSPQSVPLPKRAVAVPACVQLGTHRNEDPIAAEEGTYEGKSAYLVVLPHKTDPAHRVTAFIVDSACVKQAASAGTLLYTHDYDRD
ncbi:anti-sigma factor family protein [Streptomyces sp. NPDC102406]|uniref:anti-sigma factor family protein n=1 Tax=Streptomyces sp. NPDC102406 TaxID=3366171 RepID=UPI00380436F5